MRIKKFSKEHILNQLNKKKWSEISDKDDILIYDGEYLLSLRHEDESYLREFLESGTPFEVAREAYGLSPKNLRDENGYDASIEDCGEDFLMRMLAPYNAEDWDFGDLFDTKNTALLQTLFDEIYKTSIDFIKKNPQILNSKTSGFYNVDNLNCSYFIKPKGKKFREATADEIAALYQKQEVERLKSIYNRSQSAQYQEALSRISDKDRLILGI